MVKLVYEKQSDTETVTVSCNWSNICTAVYTTTSLVQVLQLLELYSRTTCLVFYSLSRTHTHTHTHTHTSKTYYTHTHTDLHINTYICKFNWNDVAMASMGKTAKLESRVPVHIMYMTGLEKN